MKIALDTAHLEEKEKPAEQAAANSNAKQAQKIVPVFFFNAEVVRIMLQNVKFVFSRDTLLVMAENSHLRPIRCG